MLARNISAIYNLERLYSASYVLFGFSVHCIPDPNVRDHMGRARRFRVSLQSCRYHWCNYQLPERRAKSDSDLKIKWSVVRMTECKFDNLTRQDRAWKRNPEISC